MKYIYKSDKPKAYGFGYVEPNSVWVLNSIPDSNWEVYREKEIKEIKKSKPKEVNNADS